MRVIKDFMRCFLYITMGILIVCAVNFQLSDAPWLPKETLWQILLSGALTAGVTILLYPREGVNKSIFWIQLLIHYAVLCMIMVFCGHWFGWLDLGTGGIVMMVVSVAVVYVLTFVIHYLIDQKSAKEINQKLWERYGDKNM